MESEQKAGTLKQDLALRMVVRGQYDYLPLVSPEDLNKPCAVGATPLWIVCSLLDCEGVAALLAAGADPAAPGTASGRFPLDDVIEGAIESEGDPDSKDDAKARAARAAWIRRALAEASPALV